MCEYEPLRGNSKFRCERSIIISELWRAGSEAGSYVLISVGEKANLLCESKFGRVYTFLPAVYHIHLPGGCTLHGTDQDWILEGYVTITSSVSVWQSPVSIKILHDIHHLFQEQQLHLAQVPDWIPVKDLPAVLPTSIPPLAPLSFLDHHGVLPVLNSSSSLIVIGTLVTVGLYLAIKLMENKSTVNIALCPSRGITPVIYLPQIIKLDSSSGTTHVCRR